MDEGVVDRPLTIVYTEVLMWKHYTLGLMIFLFQVAMAQSSISLEIELPLCQGVNERGSHWQTGDYATYNIYLDETEKPIGKHTIKIGERSTLDQAPHYEVSTVLETEKNQKTTLSFTVPEALTPGFPLEKAKNVVVNTDFGEFRVQNSKVRPNETFMEIEKSLQKVLDKEMTLTRYKVEFDDGLPPNEVWANPSLGPYGIYKAKVWLKDKYKVYVLQSYGMGG
jgi:hypothetical protein